MSKMPHLDRADSLTNYGNETPYQFQEDMTKDILNSAKLPPMEALKLANEEQKRMKRLKLEDDDDDDFMSQINKLEKRKKTINQVERGSRLYENYKKRNTKRMTPLEVNSMVEKVNETRKNRGEKLEKGGRKRRHAKTKRRKTCKRKKCHKRR